jgi:hypothetical protein
MDPLRISGERDQFYSLHLALSFRYEGEEPKPPNAVEVQIQTVVKGQRLNSDLNIQFIADAEKIFLSSNRWAVRDPIPGRRMIGERIEMRMPVATFLRLSSANYAAIQMGKTTFVLGKEQKRALKEFAKRMSVSGARLYSPVNLFIASANFSRSTFVRSNSRRLSRYAVQTGVCVRAFVVSSSRAWAMTAIRSLITRVCESSDWMML